jgi:hypothetical protein
MADKEKRALARCRKCGCKLIKEYASGKRKLRTNILVWDDRGRCIVKCPDCKSDNLVPVELNLESEKKKSAHVVFTG